MKYPVRQPMIVTQGYSEKHPAVDLRNTDMKTHITYPHYAMENSVILKTGKGKTYGENYILLKGESGLYYLYCHNVLMNGLVDSVEEGDEVGIPDLSGLGNTGYHLHLEIFGDKYIRRNPLEIFNEFGLKWSYKDGKKKG